MNHRIDLGIGTGFGRTVDDDLVRLSWLSRCGLLDEMWDA
jgi:hypothetical protein